MITRPTSDDISTIDFSKMAIVLDGGLELPIVNMFDEDNDHTADPEEACTLVAGMENVWFSLYIEDFGHLVKR